MLSQIRWLQKPSFESNIEPIQRKIMPEDLPQTPFSFGPSDVSELAENPEQRCPCVLLLDTSGSMAGLPIQELNQALKAFQEELAADTLGRKRVELALVTFGPVKLQTDFVVAENFLPPDLTASGDTPMGAAIELAIELVARRKEVIRQHLGPTMCLRPWIFLITDGGPTDPWQNAAASVHAGDNDERKAFSFFAVGVQGAKMEILSQISRRPPVLLDGLRFRDMFVWLSSSLSGIARSQPGAAVPMAPPDWTSVSS
jgi:uncharacterized protein YegL